jgi:release factor glutamine methyltransferase
MAIESTKQLYDYVFRRIEVYEERERRQLTEIVLEYFLDVTRTAILIDTPIEQPSDELKQELRDVCKRINQLEPIQYILGEAKFYGFDFFVAPGVLIPRPETEELVDLIQKKFQITDQPTIIDLGTGSGCIAISLAQLLPNANISAIDVSDVAIAIAKDNILENEVNVQLFKGDILVDDLPEKEFYDIVVSNPPYITEKEKTDMSTNVLDHEPHLALFVPDNDPLKFYKRIADLALVGLKKGGKLYLELNENYSQDTKKMVIEKGFIAATIEQDLQGKDRVLIAQKG